MSSIELGWPLPKRQQYFADHSKAATEHHRLYFMGKRMSLPIITAPIGSPKYRLLNGRTVSLQQEFLADHPEMGPDFFRLDPERDTVQEAQHTLLRKLVGGAELSDYFKDANHKQTDPLILDCRGFVINGNRRLCCWRDLYGADPTKYEHFSHVDAVVLPPADERAIDQLEARLQIYPELRDEYSWHAKANMMLDRQRLHNLSTKDLASMYNMSETGVKQLFDAREYAVQYLKSRERENHWGDVTDNEFAFKKIAEKRKAIPSTGEKRLYEEAAFALLDGPKDGRLYQTVQDLHAHLPRVKEKLREAFPPASVSTADNEASQGEDFFGPVNGAASLGGGDLWLATEIAKPENRVQAAEIIAEVIDSEKALAKDRTSANSVLSGLQKANAEVQQALNCIRPESVKTGVRQQMEQIEVGLARIREWLDGAGS